MSRNQRQGSNGRPARVVFSISSDSLDETSEMEENGDIALPKENGVECDDMPSPVFSIIKEKPKVVQVSRR